MRKSFVLLLLLAMLIQTAAVTIIVLQFEFQRQEITRTSCVQRKAKKNTCHGDCQLKKKLAREEQREQELMLNFESRFEAIPVDRKPVFRVLTLPHAPLLMPLMSVEVCSGFIAEMLRPPGV